MSHTASVNDQNTAQVDAVEGSHSLPITGGGSSAVVQVAAEGGGEAPAEIEGGSTSTVEVDAQSGGSKKASGGSSATVQVAAESGGEALQVVGTCRKLNGTDGSEEWSFDEVADPEVDAKLTAIDVDKDYVYVANNEVGEIVKLNRSNGSENSRIDHGYHVERNALRVDPDGNFLIGTKDPPRYRFLDSAGAQQWEVSTGSSAEPVRVDMYPPRLGLDPDRWEND